MLILLEHHRPLHIDPRCPAGHGCTTLAWQRGKLLTQCASSVLLIVSQLFAFLSVVETQIEADVELYMDEPK